MMMMPPRLALKLLERAVPGGQALVGDLVESVANGHRSAWWLWWQVVAALVWKMRHEQAEIRPLRLVELPPVEAIERGRIWQSRRATATVGGTTAVGPLGLGLLLGFVTVMNSGLWLIALIPLTAGTLAGLALAMRRSHTPELR